jgi:GDP-D-mannose dehydratase
MDPALARPVDVPVLVGANAKLRRATGWVPRFTRDDIIDDLIHAATR